VRQPERRLEHHALDQREPLGVELLDGRDVLDPGVVHQDVRADVATQTERVDRRGVGEIGDQVLAAHLGGHLHDAGLVTIEDQHLRTGLGQTRGDGAADAAGASADQRDATLQGACRGDVRLTHGRTP
jgi:hypothetical protein